MKEKQNTEPYLGLILQSWDWIYSDKNTKGYSIGSTFTIVKDGEDKHRIVVLDVVFDRWKLSELTFQIVRLYEKWRPAKVLLEKRIGWEFLREDLMRTTQKLGVSDMIGRVYFYKERKHEEK